MIFPLIYPLVRCWPWSHCRTRRRRWAASWSTFGADLWRLVQGSNHCGWVYQHIDLAENSNLKYLRMLAFSSFRNLVRHWYSPSASLIPVGNLFDLPWLNCWWNIPGTNLMVHEMMNKLPVNWSSLPMADSSFLRPLRRLRVGQDTGCHCQGVCCSRVERAALISSNNSESYSAEMDIMMILDLVLNCQWLWQARVAGGI